MRKSCAALGAACVLVLAWGCASTQLSFLDKSVPQSVKSRVVADAGIAAFNDVLVGAGDLSKVPVVREFFVNALRFDPGNTTAQRYLSLVDGFKAARFKEILGEAKALARKPGRNEDETLRLCVLVQRALVIDANDPDLAKLQKDINAARDALVKAYLAKAKAALDKKAKATTTATREAFAISAFLTLVKANSADPSNGQVRGLLSRSRPEVNAIVQRELGSVPSLIAVASYTKARTQIDHVAGLNTKLGGSFDAQVDKAYYDLNFAWAKYFYDKEDYAKADIKIAAALVVRQDTSAIALRQKIQTLKAKAEQGTNYEESLAIVDGLMRRGSLAQAMRVLSALTVNTTDKGKRDQIEEYKSRIKGALADLYAKGVAAYQAEKFDEAIDALDDIVGIDPSYQQAADYLEKARAKQQLLLDN